MLRNALEGAGKKYTITEDTTIDYPIFCEDFKVNAGVNLTIAAPGGDGTNAEDITFKKYVVTENNNIPAKVAEALASFEDGFASAPWAEKAMAYLVKTGTISGSHGKLSPENTSARAEMAQVLYNLLSK